MVVVGLAGSFCATANASPEPPGAYDGRSVGMAGTGTAYGHSAVSIFHNPAGLTGMKRLSLALTLSPLFPTTNAPVTGPNTDLGSKTTVYPLFFVGAAYRLSEKVVAGVAAYPTVGFGGRYDLPMVEKDLDVRVMAGQVVVAAAIKLLPRLSLGVGYRVTYVRLEAHQPPSMAAPGGRDLEVDGFNFLGVKA